MTFVVTENCIKCKYTECVDVCPVDCFHEGPEFLVIDQDNCICCGICEPVCPSNAIYSEDELPYGQEIFISINEELSKKWPLISHKKSPLPGADIWNGKSGKYALLGFGASTEELDTNLNDPLSEVRVRAITFAATLTDKQIELAINDSDSDVSLALITRREINLSPAQIEQCLRDENPEIRAAVASRNIFALTPEQIEKALKDNNLKVQLAVLHRGDIDFTAEQFHWGLNNKDKSISEFFIKLLTKNANELFYEQALTNEDPVLREKGYTNVATLNPEQVNRGITDPVLSVRLACAKRSECEITAKTLEEALFSEYSALINTCLKKYTHDFTDNHINLGLKNPDYEIRSIFAASPKSTLSASQITKLLKDKSVRVRVAVAYRDDFEPTPEQLTQGLTDKSYEVREAFTRFIKRANLLKTQLKLQNNPIEVLTEDQIVKRLPTALLTELKAANSRLRQRIDLKDILISIGNTARWGEGACVFLQPGDSGYNWSTRIIPLIFIVNTNEGIRIRITRGRSYRNFGATPATWPELRGFPRGNSPEKLTNWASATDGCLIPMDLALSMPEGKLECYMQDWLFLN